MIDQEILFPEKEKAALVKVDSPAPKDNEISGETLFSLVSTGTETAVYQGLSKTAWGAFPFHPGYSAAFKITKVGKDVKKFKVGDIAFNMGKHKSIQVCAEQDAVKIPDGLDPKIATIARIMAVSMTTLTTTTARPPSKVIITGLGIVGHLAVKNFVAAGYEVYGVDPSADKREIAKAGGIKNILTAIPVTDPEFVKKVTLVVDCSGHEQAILDGCSVVKIRGEVVCLGAPWRKYTNLSASDLIDKVYHNYVTLRSGWEWELDRYPTNKQVNANFDNIAGALRWLNEGAVKVDTLYKVVSPKDCQEVYQALMKTKFEKLVAIFDWN